MPSICSVTTCSFRHFNNSEISLHRFPKDDHLKKRWTILSGISKDIKNARICSSHFHQDSFKTEHGKRNLVINAEPTENVPGMLKYRVEISDAKSKSYYIKLEDGNSIEVMIKIKGEESAKSKSKPALIIAENLYCSKRLEEEREIELLFQNRSLKLELEVLKESSPQKFVEFAKIWKTKLDIIKAKQVSEKSKWIQKEKELRLIVKVQKPSKKTFRQKFSEVIGHIFTPLQQKIILEKLTRTNYTTKEITQSLVLRQYAGSKGHDFVRNCMKIPMPSISTIKRYCSNIHFQPGHQDNILQIIDRNVSSEFEKNCVLDFDEMKMSPEVCFESKTQTVYGPHSNLQVAAIRSIFGKWKFPIYFDFDTPMTKDILFQLIKKAEQNNLHVRGVVCDYGGPNRKVKNDLGITVEKTYFLNPENEDKIFFFPDFVHMLKLLRNHMLKSGLCLSDGTIINKSLYEKLLKSDANELHICGKISEKDLNLTDTEKMNVARAFKMFSNTVAAALKFIGETRVAEFIKLVNDACDIMNSRFPDGKGYKAPYGKNLAEQVNILNEFKKEILGLRVGPSLLKNDGKKVALYPFQNGMNICVESFMQIYEHLKTTSNYPVQFEYLLASRFNQDFLENMFSIIRSLGRSTNPSPVDCIIRLKTYFLSQILNPLKNTMVLPESESEKGLDLFQELLDICQDYLEDEDPNSDELPTQNDISSTYNEHDYDEINIQDVEISSSNWSQIISELSKSEKNEFCAKEYISGFIANKFKSKFPELIADHNDVRSTVNWIETLSNGNLVQPSFYWFNLFTKFDKEFLTFHHNSRNKLNLDRKPKVMDRLITILKIKFPEISQDIIKLFVRTRTFARINHLKRIINESVMNRSRELRFTKLKLSQKQLQNNCQDDSETDYEFMNVDENDVE